MIFSEVLVTYRKREKWSVMIGNRKGSRYTEHLCTHVPLAINDFSINYKIGWRKTPAPIKARRSNRCHFNLKYDFRTVGITLERCLICATVCAWKYLTICEQVNMVPSNFPVEFVWKISFWIRNNTITHFHNYDDRAAFVAAHKIPYHVWSKCKSSFYPAYHSTRSSFLIKLLFKDVGSTKYGATSRENIFCHRSASRRR